MSDSLSYLFERSCCPVANVLDLVGDKWTLLIVRDLLLGKRRYGEFIQSPEKIPSNILADRLKKLESAGILKKNAYHDKPTRYDYQLTEKGYDLQKVLAALGHWGLKYIPGTQAFVRYG